MNRSLRNRLLLGAAGLLLIGGLLHVGLGSRITPNATTPGATAAKGGGGPRAVPVQVEQATQSDVTVTLDAIGRAEAYSTVSVRARVSGQLQSLSFTPGRRVRQGETIARIDPTLFDAQLRQAEGALARDQA